MRVSTPKDRDALRLRAPQILSRGPVGRSRSPIHELFGLYLRSLGSRVLIRPAVFAVNPSVLYHGLRFLLVSWWLLIAAFICHI